MLCLCIVCSWYVFAVLCVDVLLIDVVDLFYVICLLCLFIDWLMLSMYLGVFDLLNEILNYRDAIDLRMSCSCVKLVRLHLLM